MNIKKILAKLEAVRKWLRLRKKTVVAHWLYGALSAGFSAAFFPAGFLLMYVFERWERWNDQCDGTHEGAMDWWDAYLIFGIGLAIILALHFGYSGYSIRWY